MTVESCLSVIAARAPGFVPQVGLVLGSGLGALADEVQAVAAVPYGDLPGFPPTSVSGHAGRLVLGHVGATPVAVMQGRAHYYEQGRADAMRVPVRTLARIGCGILLLTNAAGSLRAEMRPGGVMLIVDHINLTGQSPLLGEAGDDRFVDLSAAYDRALAEGLRRAAGEVRVRLHEGVYMWFGGPNFETPAEIRAAAQLGADAVGMSTVPEVVLARHAGMRVAALSIITNVAAGLGEAGLSHAQTLDGAERASADVRRLLVAFLRAMTA